jgi:hypothetical protein
MERHQAKMKRAEERCKRLAQVEEEQSALMRERAKAPQRPFDDLTMSIIFLRVHPESPHPSGMFPSR